MILDATWREEAAALNLIITEAWPKWAGERLSPPLPMPEQLRQLRETQRQLGFLNDKETAA